MTIEVAVIALTKGRSTLCLMAVGAQEIRGVLQPGARVAIAVPLVLWGATRIASNVFDRCLQGVQQVLQGGVERRFVSI